METAEMQPGRDLELGAQVTFEASAMKNGISRYAMFGVYSAYYLYMYSRFTWGIRSLRNLVLDMI